MRDHYNISNNNTVALALWSIIFCAISTEKGCIEQTVSAALSIKHSGEVLNKLKVERICQCIIFPYSIPLCPIIQLKKNINLIEWTFKRVQKGRFTLSCL